MDEYDLSGYGGDELNLNPAPIAPQQREFAPPVPQEPFSTADDLQLQRLQSNLGSVREQVWNGELHPLEGEQISSQIMKQAAPLASRKKQAEQQLKQEAAHRALDESAMQTAITQQNAAFDAKGFGDRTAQIMDPQTGRSVTMYQHEPGKWSQVDFGQGDTAGTGEDVIPEPAPEEPPTPEPKLETAGDGKHRLTIYNGANRSEVVFGQDASSPSGMRVIEQKQYDAMGRPVEPGQKQQTDNIRQMAMKEMGTREPPQFIPGPGGRPMINPAWSHWDTGVRQIDARIRQQRGAQEAANRKQVEVDYADALSTHKIGEFAESADPHAAREEAIMGDFARKHPNDPRVVAWQNRQQQQQAALAQKEPDAMSLGQLATATLGPRASVKAMVADEVKALEKMKDTPVGGGRTFADDAGGEFASTPTTTWGAMPHAAIVKEANQRVRRMLTEQLNDQRRANSPASKSEGGDLPQAGQNQPAKAAPAQTPVLTPEEASAYARISAKPAAAAAEAVKANEPKVGFWERIWGKSQPHPTKDRRRD